MRLAIFDFDGTLFPEDTLPFIMKQWKRQKYPMGRWILISVSVAGLYLRYKIGLMHEAAREEIAVKSMHRFTRIFSGMSEAQISAFLERCAEQIIPDLDAVVVKEVRKAKEEGAHTVLLSGCYESLLAVIGRHLNVDTVIGTKLRYKDGLIDLEDPLNVVCGPKKVEEIQRVFGDENMDWNASTAYADSSSDIELLKRVGQPVVVNPDPFLKDTASKMNWPILWTGGSPAT